jgi:PAP2 superfamily.
MRHKFLLYLLLPLICESSLFAQNPALRDSVERNKYNFSQFGNETWSFIKQPTRWDGSDWLKIGLAGAGTFLVMQVADQPIRDAVLRDHRYDKSVPIEGGRVWGELYAPVVLFSGFALHSIITGDMGTRKIAYEVGQASLYAGGITYLLKMAIGRSRPYNKEGTKSFYPFGVFALKTDYQSFPGGHTTAGMVLSTVLSRNVKSDWLKGLAYVPVAFTFVSRIYQDQHWTSDDFAGATLGYFVATWVVDQHEQEEDRIKVSSIYPLTISIALN